MSIEPKSKNEAILDKKVNDKNNENIDDNSSNLKTEKKKNEDLKEKKKLIAIYFLSGLIVLSIIIFILVFDFFPDYTKGTIECTYYTQGKEIEILNSNFNTDNLQFIINDKEIDDKNPKYKENGEFRVTIKVLIEELDMKNMFAFTNIKTVKMISDKNLKIKNMASSFENCYLLEKFEIEGFITTEVTNMSKLFYNATNLKDVNIQKMDTTNLKDMSYMFAYTNISHISIPNFSITPLLYSQGVFEGCNSTILIKKDSNVGKVIEELKSKYPDSTFKYDNK